MAEIGGWESVRGAVRARIGESAFEAWFRALSGEIEGTKLVLCCPDRFSRDFLSARYHRALLDAAPGVTDVEYRVDAKAAEAARAAAPAPRLAEAPSVRAVHENTTDASEEAEAEAEPFADFVVGPGNALAHQAALRIARGNPGRLNPFVVVGPSGVGKTHLVQSVRQSLGSAVVYRSSDEFTSEVTRGIRSRGMDEVRHRYRTAANVLILEDIHFLEGRKATQIELFHTLDHLIARGKSVVLTADRSPQELRGLDPALRSRLCQGLVAFMRPPDHETRLRILRDRAAGAGIRVPGECLELLARRNVRSVRDLVAGLNQVVARASLLRQSVTEALVEEALQALGVAGAGHELEDLVELVSTTYGVSLEELRGRSRAYRVGRPRQLAMYLCRHYTEASLRDIARHFGRDRTTVLYAISAVEKRITEKPQLRYELEALAARLAG